MTPATPAAMRAALEARLVNQAASLGIEAGRLRRRLVFQRIVRRLSGDDRWVLKGGYLLEARLEHRARTTRDLDLASALAAGVEPLRDALATALDQDPEGDFFRFSITGAAALRPDDAGQGGWRFSVEVRIAGRVFDRVRVDVVARVAETSGSTELIDLPAPVDGVDLGPAQVLAVDVAQHAAEKFHAICRTYAGNRPSTRVKDLVDVVLLVEAGLLPDPRLPERLRMVFAARDGQEPPLDLPEPPASWARDYEALVTDVGAATGTLPAAMSVATAVYQQALA
ncbi:nucleotidyl transferase AbiEii/AbiGii toxin family protein [Blastococcus saxobsidens]|uniref:Nucleotidyl transferase AbiEii/AbiGii toxin family protein n=1 Tax=Blastococcus saxobsidens TaxID=138336 RepID=A0A6L9W4U5_9ACTN|nr:nucleotidyl transferase AbiEii/AbiGii toxin family protein [Blastococcus saxobsidens]NEK87047.1 nucleotidyl transferase AbiEii/AbiGii toxin family protein [Blastococcus saxobsidens]